MTSMSGPNHEPSGESEIAPDAEGIEDIEPSGDDADVNVEVVQDLDASAEGDHLRGGCKPTYAH